MYGHLQVECTLATCRAAPNPGRSRMLCSVCAECFRVLEFRLEHRAVQVLPQLRAQYAYAAPFRVFCWRLMRCRSSSWLVVVWMMISHSTSPFSTVQVGPASSRSWRCNDGCPRLLVPMLRPGRVLRACAGSACSLCGHAYQCCAVKPPSRPLDGARCTKAVDYHTARLYLALLC